MKKRKYKVYACDFETTVYKGQTNTEVWAAAAVELFTEDVKIYHSLPELFEAFKQVNSNIIAYFHNLKFDGMFWLSFLMTELKLQQACEYLPANDKEELSVKWLKESQMQNNSFKYSISDRGMWYTITIKVNNKIIEIRDSLKLLPFSIRKIGNSFGTKHKKLEMEYTGLRYAGCTITDDERSYIANDVLVLKEALEIMFQQGHDKLTIGSCCLAEYERIIGKEDYKIFFPNIYEVQIDESVYGVSNAGEFRAEEVRALRLAAREFRKGNLIGCTGCGYCRECPKGVNIPKIFAGYNQYLVGKDRFQLYNAYVKLKDEEKVRNCIKCGSCMTHCPQGIPITEKLGEVQALVDEINANRPDSWFEL